MLFAFSSCKKQNIIETLPMEKLYILEYNYVFPEEHEEPCYKFFVAGFTGLDKDFNLKYARQLSYNSYHYYNSEDIVPDSLRNEISDILLRYPADTTFLYQGEPGSRIYDGNAYRFIMQRNNQKDITIKFEPRFLPEDLKFVYSYLYGNRKKTEHRSEYDELFRMFENQVKDDELLPLPVLKKTIEFKPPS